jgi:endoglucanase
LAALAQTATLPPGMFRRLVSGFLGLALLAGCDAGESSSGGAAATVGPPVLRGCTVDNAPPTAPGGYYTNGATVCTADGTAHLFHGVDRPSMEWGSTGENIGPDDFNAMAGWHANVVRIALNQDFWLSGAALYDPEYQARVDQAVSAAEAAGLDVILDLHWSDRGNLSVTKLSGQDQNGTSNQQEMADVNSQQFWLEVATKYKTDGHVLFELYNEPNTISWSLWLNGGKSSFTVVGMQALYDTVRKTAGANNIVIAGGLSWAFDLTGVGAAPISGYNIIYATHPYKPQDPQAAWEGSFGYLATRDIAPVIATEFGDGTSNCTGAWDSALIGFADTHHISWTAWAWYPAGCSFPALISKWDYTPTVQGQAVQAALLAYPYSPGGTLVNDAGVNDAGMSDAGLADATGEGGADGAAASTPEGGPSSDGGASGASNPTQ